MDEASDGDMSVWTSVCLCSGSHEAPHRETHSGLTHEEISDRFMRKEEVSSYGGRQMMGALK